VARKRDEVPHTIPRESSRTLRSPTVAAQPGVPGTLRFQQFGQLLLESPTLMSRTAPPPVEKRPILYVGYLTGGLLVAMEHVSLTVSVPKAIKNFIEVRFHQGTFSTPSEYILLVNQQKSSRSEPEAFLRVGRRTKTLPTLAGRLRAAENLLPQMATHKRSTSVVAN
jgi:hypothetical protein